MRFDINPQSKFRCAAFITLFLLLASADCKNSVSTEELLKAQGFDSRLSLSETSVAMPVNTTRSFNIIGGKAPFNVKVLGSGTASISGNSLSYAAGALIDNVSLNVTDSQNFLATVSVDVQGVSTDPTAITGAALWLKADALSLADNATATSWPDSSGNSRDFAAGTGGTFRTNFVNGRPVLSFNGTSQYLERAYDAGLNTSTMTLFVLHYPETIAPAVVGPPFMSRQGTGLGGYYFYLENNGLASGYHGASTTPWVQLVTQTTLTANNWYLWELRIDGSSFTYHQNAALQGQLSMALRPFTVNSTRPQWIAAGPTDVALPSFYYTGKIAEIIYFNRALTTGEGQGIRCYLKNKYGLGYGC